MHLFVDRLIRIARWFDPRSFRSFLSFRAGQDRRDRAAGPYFRISEAIRNQNHWYPTRPPASLPTVRTLCTYCSVLTGSFEWIRRSGKADCTFEETPGNPRNLFDPVISSDNHRQSRRPLCTVHTTMASRIPYTIDDLGGPTSTSGANI